MQKSAMNFGSCTLYLITCFLLMNNNKFKSKHTLILFILAKHTICNEINQLITVHSYDSSIISTSSTFAFLFFFFFDFLPDPADGSCIVTSLLEDAVVVALSVAAAGDMR